MTVDVVAGPGVTEPVARGVLEGVGEGPGVVDADSVGDADEGVAEADGSGVGVAAEARDAVGKLNTGVALASRLDAVIGLVALTGSIRMPSCEPAFAVALDGTNGPLPQATVAIAKTAREKSRAAADRPARHPCNDIT